MSSLVSKTLDDVRTALFERLDEKQEEYAAAGYLPIRLNLNRGIARGLIELWAWGLYQLYAVLAWVLEVCAFADTATGTWLDLHCKQVGVVRKSATKAGGDVVFYRSGTSGNVPITAGKIVKTLPDGLGDVYRFVTTEDAVLLDGETEVTVAVTAEEYGVGSNVATGQVSVISTAVDGVDGVRNDSDWLASEGTDEEDDDRLRERYWLAWAALNGCTAAAYESWARSVTGVAGVIIMDQHPRGQGTVDVLLRGTAGMPTDALVASVDAVVQEKAPMNDDALVAAPGGVGVMIAGELVLTGGDASAVVLAATNRIQALFSGTSVTGIDPLEIGQDLTVDMLTSTAMGGGNISKVNWSSPVDDVAVADDELAVLESLAFTYAWAEDT